MITGISTAYLDYAGLPEVFAKAASSELSLLEFSTVRCICEDGNLLKAPERPTQLINTARPDERQEIKRQAQENDILVAYSPRASIAELPRSKARLLLLDFLRQARQMNASYLLLGLGQAPDETVGLSRMIDLFRWVSGRPEARGIKVCIENLPGTKSRQLSARLENMRDFFAGVGSGNIGLNLDFGHGNLAIGNLALLEEFAERIFYTHFHDNFGKEDQHLPVGLGNIYWRPIYEKLAAINFPGPYVIEFPARYSIEGFLKELRSHISMSRPEIPCNRQ
jgi:sugar phosphate isomerase/epimerase